MTIQTIAYQNRCTKRAVPYPLFPLGDFGMIDNYRSLLKDAALIYEKYEAGRKEPFNIFTVLHKETDEVNLHSRFLHALLDHQSSDTRRQNLRSCFKIMRK